MATGMTYVVLSTFDHLSQDWNTFKSRLDQWFIANNITSGTNKATIKRRAILLMSLSEGTFKLASDLALPNKVKQLGYDVLVKLLDDHFTPKRFGFAEKSVFYSATQRPGETHTQWAARIRGLATHCGFKNLEEALLDKFIMGMAAGRERDKLLMQDQRELTLAKAIDLAESVRCARQASTQAASGVSATGGLAGAEAIFNTVKKEKCSVCVFANHKSNQCRYKSYKCKKCGNKGHLRKVYTNEGKVKYVNEGSVDEGDNDGSFRMKSQVEDDIDDDPIKLFDPDSQHDRVYYGCQLLQNGGSDITIKCQDDEDVTYKSDAELSETSETSVEDSRECVPVCVKLVDCKKFPWYYRKYTQQIIEKTHYYDFVSDSDEPEFISDSTDDDLKETITEKNSHCPLRIGSREVKKRKKSEKRLETMKLKENYELQSALQCRNNNKIDFKRNTGLIGMTITQKRLKTVEYRTQNRKIIQSKGKLLKRRKNLNDSGFLRSAHKILNGVGTELIPIGADVEDNTVANGTTPKSDNCKDANNKIAGQFNSEKMSKNLLNQITTCKTGDNFQKDELKNNESDNILYDTCIIDINMDCSNEATSPKTDKNSSNHVKNIKKTNKFKNNQIKAIEKMIMSLNKQENGTAYKGSINIEQIDDIHHSPTKITDNAREPNSPILPCSSLVKRNRDISEISNKVTNKANNFSQSINNAQNIGDLYSLQNVNKQTPQSYDINTTHIKPCKNTKDESFKSSPKLQDVSAVVEERSQFSEDRLINKELKKDNVCDKVIAKLKDSENKNMDTNCKGELINRSICVVSIKNNSTQNKPAGIVNHNNINRKIVPISANISQNKPKTTASEVNKLNQLINTVKQHPTPTTNGFVNNTLNGDAPRNINNPNNVANPYASAIILRPNAQPDSRMPVRFSQPNFEPRVPNPIQPQLHQNPYFANFQKPHAQTPPQPHLYSYCGPDQRFIPRSANCAVPNYRFPSPHMLAQYDNRYPTPCYSAPYQTMNNHGQQSNAFLKQGVSTQMGPQPPQGSCNTFEIRPQPKSVSKKNNITPMNISQINNYPQINNISQHNKNTNISNITEINNLYTFNKESDKRTVVAGKRRLPKTINSLPLKSEAISSKDSGILNASKRHKEPCNKINLIERKAKMLEVLNRATDKSKMQYESGSKNVMEEVGIAFKRPRLSNKVPANNQNQVELLKGYSAPILPIPTYEKLMFDQMVVDLPKQDTYTEKNTNIKKQIEKSNKIKPQGGIRKDDTKKISFEEYKKRTLKFQGKCNDNNKKKFWNLKGNDKNIIMLQDENRGNIDRFSTESDLGYDSDSTVII